MDASQLKKLSESYATIAEGGKHEKSAMDWNKRDDNPKGKKVDKKKVDKCTCESFYLKRLKAMNPVMAEKYLAIAEIFIEEGYESSRFIDNLVEALPKEVVGEDFRAALHAVNPRIYENLDTAEKKQARAIVLEFRMKSWDEWKRGIQSIPGNLQRAGQAAMDFINPPASKSSDPVVRQGGSYTGRSGTATNLGPTPEQKAEKLRQQRQETQDALRGTTGTAQTGERSAAANDARQQAAKAQAQAARTGGSGGPTRLAVEPYSGSGSTAPARPTPTPAQIPKTTNRDGSSATRTAPNAAGLTPMQQWAKNFPSLAAKVKPGASGSKEIAALKNSHEPEGDLVEDGAYIPSRIDDFNSDADMLKRMGKPSGGRIPSPGGGGQYDKPPRYRTGAMRLAKGKGKKTTQVAHFEPQGELVDEGSMKQARKNVGASTCWDGYKAKGTKKKNGRDVPNCVKEEEVVDESLQQAVDNLTKKAQGGLERMGVKINRTSRPTMTKQEHDAKIKSGPNRSYGNRKEEVEAVDEGLKQARKNVGADTCWDGYKAKGTKKKNGREVPNCVKEEDITEKKGLWDNIHAKRKRGEKPAKPGDKDYPKTLNVEGYDKPDEKLKTDRDGYRISDKEADAAKERIRKKTEEKRKKMNIRGNDSDEQKKRLEKKRGMKLDDHPQFKKEDYNVYDIILTYLDENDLMESVEEAEEIMMQLTGSQIVEIIDEFMNMDESMASASRMKEIKSQGLDRPARSREFEQRLPAKRGSRGREFEHGSTRSSNTPSGNLSRNRGMAVNNTGRARSQEFEHGSTRSRNTPSGNLADKSPRTKDGKLMY